MVVPTSVDKGRGGICQPQRVPLIPGAFWSVIQKSGFQLRSSRAQSFELSANPRESAGPRFPARLRLVALVALAGRLFSRRRLDAEKGRELLIGLAL